MRSKRNIHTANAGISLLEVLCALTLITAGVFASMQVFHQSADHTLALAQEQRALRIMENEIERLRATPFDQMPLGEERPLLSAMDELAPLPNAVGAVRIAAHAELAGLREVTVKVTWSGTNARRITRSLTTLLAEEGVGR